METETAGDRYRTERVTDTKSKDFQYQGRSVRLYEARPACKPKIWPPYLKYER